MLGEPLFVFRGDNYLTFAALMTSLAALHLVNKGNLGFLALVHNVAAEVPKLDQVPVVKEFLNIFPTELPRMPLEREIEFCMDLIPDT